MKKVSYLCLASLVLVGAAFSLIWAQSSLPPCDQKLYTVSCETLEGFACLTQGSNCLGTCIGAEQCSAGGVMVDVCFTPQTGETVNRLNCTYQEQNCGIVLEGTSECYWIEIPNTNPTQYTCGCEYTQTTRTCFRYHIDDWDDCEEGTWSEGGGGIGLVYPRHLLRGVIDCPASEEVNS